ncbi:MAG: M23 family metallopeptidase [Armatimonadota bacterium]|nr:M23 family metallopeptidase [Armatimonadota bacterium]MDR7426048.1 M23 family metallopeptidase [Armatimonadota bacterium]MDR7469432.1 M23 family metallopeptidase [Armatimonadota bacterium]MDR7474249.1 M23 family metallopeptidase [Armatimonadota bacterium]MDR7538530.1 M23 family metallopeptidase [Armatimonadota bacterium]
MASQVRRLALLHGLEVFVRPQPASAPTVLVEPGASLAPDASAVVPDAAAVPAEPVFRAVGRREETPSAAGSALGRLGLRHRVASGDTLFDLARRYRTTVQAIAAVNVLSSPHTLRIGQELVIPRGTKAPAVAASAPRRPARPAAASTPRRPATGPGAAVAYRVQPGDTLFSLARRYRTSVDAIVAANGLPSADRLRVGQQLVLPGERGRAPGGLATRAPRPTLVARPALSWPARGMITSRYGWRFRQHHDGIDLAAAWGTPIHAALPGQVVLAGWYYGYGLTVILDHGGGLRTLYGHASRLLVRPGQGVQQGERIALVGCTGRCTGAHVHFEVRLNGRPVNPLRYLR